MKTQDVIMSAYSNYHFTDTVRRHEPTKFHFADLDSWVSAADGTAEYYLRFDLAKEIFNCHINRFRSFTLNGGNLTSLPKALVSLYHLEELQIFNIPITVLPAEIRHLRNLKKLHLSGLDIDSLPPEIALCSNLIELKLINSSVKIIPAEIGKLQNLEVLSLEGNQSLSYLPEQIGQLRNLRLLDLTNCNLAYLPKTLFFLKRLEKLILTDCPLSTNALNNLWADIEENDFHQCAITYNQRSKCRNDASNMSLNELFEEVQFLACKKRKKKFSNLCNHQGTQNLSIFLKKILSLEEFQHQALTEKVIEYLVRAETVPSYRERFFACLEGLSFEEREENILLRFLRLAVEKKLDMANLYDFKELYKLLQAGWTMDLVIDIARAKVNTLTACDPVQVYLSYLSQFNQWHDLTLDNTVLQSYKTTEIEPLEAHIASQQIEGELANLTKQSEFLACHDLWKKALMSNSPSEYARLNREGLARWTKDIIAPFARAASQWKERDSLEQWRCGARGKEYSRRFVAERLMRDCWEKELPELNLRGLGLTSLPEGLGNFQHLRVLDLRGNNLPQLPNEIYQLNLGEKLLLDT